jgi:phage terminase large subunit
MDKLTAEIPEAFEGLLEPHRYKVFYGGRGGGKSQTFAIVLLLMGMQKPIRVLCAREVQKSIKDSVKRLLDDEISRLGLGGFYTSLEAEIRGANGTLFVFYGLHNMSSLKSMKGLTHCWVEEAESISDRSLDILRPTIREPGSELWFSFNPEHVHSPIWQQFIIGRPEDALVKKVTWRDNPWFPDVLDEERRHCLQADPDKYDWIWEGNPRVIAEGSYYGKLLQQAEQDGRIGKVPCEPQLLVNTAWDLGMSDSTAIWFFQHLPVGHMGEWRFIDYYEASGEGLAHYAEVLARKGYRYGVHLAPHDIAVRELGTGRSRLETARNLGINFAAVKNLPIMDGIEAARQVLGAAWFDRDKCAKGLNCLYGYKREYDDARAAYRDYPLHDWTSHGADAFRYAAVGYQRPQSGFKPLPKQKNLRAV